MIKKPLWFAYERFEGEKKTMTNNKPKYGMDFGLKMCDRCKKMKSCTLFFGYIEDEDDNIVVLTNGSSEFVCDDCVEELKNL